MENGSRTAHDDPRPARTPLGEQQSSLFFCFFLFRQQYIYLLFMLLVFVVLASCAPFMGNDPRDVRDVVSGTCCAFCQAGREDMGIVDVCVVVFGLIAPFSLHVRETFSDSNSDSSVFLSVFTTTVQTCVSCGAGCTENSDCFNQ